MNITKYALSIFLITQSTLLFSMDKSVDIYALAGAKHSDSVEKLQKKLDEVYQEYDDIRLTLAYMCHHPYYDPLSRGTPAPRGSFKYLRLNLRRNDALITSYAIEILLANKGVFIYEDFDPAFNLNEIKISQESKKEYLEYILKLIETRQLAEKPGKKEKSYLPEMKVEYSEELRLLLANLEGRDSEIKI